MYETIAWNHCTSLNKTWNKPFLGEEDSSLFKWGVLLSFKGES